ncbi:glycoside hydrolase family 15 protein [Pseudalkalibacillus caeni]|uniref:Glycoside hydrolase family 15 n=1 Tax=Exobacillus caeni TaxID=2574798 RepID=A0A5R9F4U3_9BACL|nr:glycoside hydrolase family 15 protein [Pseudalkalibacillus caeni]TLS37509.1 glycoside hydrolase family 15 [Pseudalkalibacillus caeni]
MLDKKLLNVLEEMRLSNGTYTASTSEDYSYVWIRDVCYTVLPFLTSTCSRYEKAYHALFDLMKKYEWKIDIHTKKKPLYTFEHIHARYSTELTEIPVEWGHAQHDAIGLFLWGIGEGIRVGKRMIRNEKDREIVQKLVYYLQCVQYWQDKDNGMWEENREMHASSIGACVAGLKSIKMLVNVPENLIQKGEEALRFMLPAESATKSTDLALLSLIFPYQVVSRNMAFAILSDVTTKLEREYGVIRYENDQYYNEGSEAEWCFGFPWLGLCYGQLGNKEKMLEYWEKTKRIIPEDGKIPELYIGGTDTPNGNTPLAWAVSMTYLLHERVSELKQSVS